MQVFLLHSACEVIRKNTFIIPVIQFNKYFREYLGKTCELGNLNAMKTNKVGSKEL